MSNIDVFKFGGVAVGSPEAIRAAVEHVRRAAPRVAVIVSAANGVTDLLLESARAAKEGDHTTATERAQRFETRHHDLIAALVEDRARATSLRATITDSANELRSLIDGIAALRELTQHAQDAIVARGERMLAQLFVEVLRENGVAAEYIDAAQIIVTERNAFPDLKACERNAKKLITPLLEQGSVVIVPGFLGRGPTGDTVTLGRGGSDFSAAILARSLSARAVTLFKEVDGLM
ncbi:MAG TPA: aspartate kinase, partial [Thermoanaerobaculia bacterium]|nr:aspartate kinase [Thermoanaerobaculia bacterium]